MDRKKLLLRNFGLLVLTILTVFLCYFYIDKQVAIWVSRHHFRSYKITKYFAELPMTFIGVVPFIYLFVVIRFSFSRWTKLDQGFLMFANGIVIAQFLKDFFKFIFGRYWPETWHHNNPSLIQNNLYSFHFFHRGAKYGAFPSGHAATLLAGITMLWILLPRLRGIFFFVALFSAAGIVAMNYHFVSDVIAGSVLGFLISLYTYRIMSWESKMDMVTQPKNYLNYTANETL